MKVCIFTFARACNYGAVLQAYALQTAIGRLGHDVSVADYTPRCIQNGNCPIPPFPLSRHPRVMRRDIPAWFRALPGRIANRRIRENRLRMFDDFANRRLHMTRPIRRTEDADKVCADAFVVGSDQIWNIGLTGGVDPFYWGMSLPRGAKLLAYAPSAGGSISHVAANPMCKDAVRRFSAIGARERQLSETLSPAFGKNIPVVADPVFLLSVDDWREIARKPAWISDKPYVFLFRVAESEPAKRTAVEWAQTKGVRLLELCIGENYPKSDGEIYGIAPEEFLWLLDHAEASVVASFHGTAFSAIFGTPFLSFGTGGAGDGRIKELVDGLHMAETFRIAHIQGGGYPKSISADLHDWRESSLAFLKEVLES